MYVNQDIVFSVNDIKGECAQRMQFALWLISPFRRMVYGFFFKAITNGVTNELSEGFKCFNNEIANENYARIGMFLIASDSLPHALTGSTFLP